MAIKILDRDTIEKITAGEVVERPVSAVKELVENSLDAGSTGITVEIKDGGLSYIRITDNGCGIPASEAKLAFQSHATSKLKNAEGLDNLMTLGFRGEALPSIASVCKVTMTTKTAEEASGIRIKVEGGIITSIEDAGCPNGTTIVVTDFFYNVPVRRTFLKKPTYEQALISELLQKLALGNPGVAFKFISSGKQIFQTYGDGSMRSAALAVYGREYAQALAEVDESEGAFCIKGLIGTGEQSAPSRSRQCFFLNGRLINCRMLSQALEEVCRGRVMIGKYPTCSLSVSMPASTVDINVHPSKLEVRFRDEAAFRLTAQTLLKRAFNEHSILSYVYENVAPSLPSKTIKEVVVPPVSEKKPDLSRFDLGLIPETPQRQASFVREDIPPVLEIKPSPKPDTVKAEAEKPKEIKSTQTIINEQTQLDSIPAAPDYRIIGVYLNTYVLLEVKDSLVIIDQHAAHERLNYEAYLKRLDDGVASQQLLVPIVLDFSPKEIELLQNDSQLLEQAGYETELFGKNSLKITAVPFIYGQSDMRLLFTELIESLDMLKRAEQERKLASIIQASCKHAVKAGDKLSDAEIRQLISNLGETNSAPTCPHGRPVMKVFTKTAMEQLFKRIQ